MRVLFISDAHTKTSLLFCDIILLKWASSHKPIVVPITSSWLLLAPKTSQVHRILHIATHSVQKQQHQRMPHGSCCFSKVHLLVCYILRLILCEIWCSDFGVADNACLLGCVLFCEWFKTSQGIRVPSSSKIRWWRQHSPSNAANHSLSHTASHVRRLQCTSNTHTRTKSQHSTRQYPFHVSSIHITRFLKIHFIIICTLVLVIFKIM